MAISKVRALQTVVRSFKNTIESTASKAGDSVSVELAKHYNSLVEKAEAFPDLKEHLPPQIPLTSMFSDMGLTNAKYPDLLVFLNQLIAMTDLLDENGT